MKKWRGQRGQQMSGLPKLHARGDNGKPLCGARPRKWGSLFAQFARETDCERCKDKLPPPSEGEQYGLGYMQGSGAA